MKNLTQKEFIESCINKHGNRYDYSLVEYKNTRSKIKIICKEHGVFEQNSKNHRDGQGCPKCSGNYRIDRNTFIRQYGRDDYDYRLLKDPFSLNSLIKIINKSNNLTYIQWAYHHKNGLQPTKIESNSLVKKLKKIHNNLYDYVIEKDSYYSTDKIKLVNNLTGDENSYRVDRHLNGMKPNKVTLNLFLQKSKLLHGSIYDYSKIKEIKNGKDKVEIICKKHGVFKQVVSNHMNLGHGCPKCVGVGKWNTDLLISEFKKVHRDKFDYSKVKFENVSEKVEIMCEEHGSFYQNIYQHLRGEGCGFCKTNSKGEEYIKMWLDGMNIKYIRQKSFKDCKYINSLSFDFYLPKYEMCIEFDGLQHYKPVSYFGGADGFKKSKKRDKVKDEWCLKNNIKLLRIKYNEINKIQYILKENLQLVD